MRNLSASFSGEVGNHVLEIAGLHRFGHIFLCLLDPFIGDLNRDQGRADFLGMLENAIWCNPA